VGWLAMSLLRAVLILLTLTAAATYAAWFTSVHIIVAILKELLWR
jgi:hypothetical protein